MNRSYKPSKRLRNAKPKNDRERAAQRRALDAVALSRREALSATTAAKRTGTTIDTVLKYAGTAFERNTGTGKFHVRDYDRIPRVVQHYVPDGSVTVTVHSSRTARMLADHRNALRRFGGEPDDSILDPFRNKTFRSGGKTFQFLTDPKEIQRLLQSGIRGEGLYRAIQGGAE